MEQCSTDLLAATGLDCGRNAVPTVLLVSTPSVECDFVATANLGCCRATVTQTALHIHRVYEPAVFPPNSNKKMNS